MTKRVLAKGTLRYWGALDGGPSVDLITARVFVIDYDPPFGGGDAYVTVVAEEPMYLPNTVAPAPAGSIHSLPAHDEYEGTLLTVDTSTLVGI